MKRKKLNILIVSIAILFAIGIYWIFLLQKAHSSFGDYYLFRGCTELIAKTDSYGICKTKSGETIKIVKFENKWYLDIDLPCGYLCF